MTDRDASLYKRYRQPLPQAAGSPAWNDTLETLLARRSVRRFLDQPVPPDVLESIIAAAQSAASSSNVQAWSVVAVQDPQRKARIAHWTGDQRHVANAPLLLVFISDLARLREVGRLRGAPVDGLDYFESFLISVVDPSLAAQNAVVAATSLGLGTCFIGALRNQPEAVARELGLPAESFALFGVVMGYPDPARPGDVKPRLPQSVVMHHEQYQAPQAAELDAYDGVMQTFQREQNMAVSDWTGKSARRVAGPTALGGRDTLKAMLRARGFGLK